MTYEQVSSLVAQLEEAHFDHTPMMADSDMALMILRRLAKQIRELENPGD